MQLMTAAWQRAAGALLIAQAACGSGVAPDTANLTIVEIAPGEVEVEELTPVALEARLLDDAGNEIDGISVHWTVADPAIAEVTQDGVVTGRSEGETAVAASARGVSDVAEVRILPRAVATVRVTPDKADLDHGGTISFSVVALDRQDREIDDRSVTWSSSNSKIARVDGEGRVTGVGAGSAKIRATIDGQRGEATVNVKPPPVDRVEISPESATLTVGDSRRFEATARGKDGSQLDGRSVSWSSADRSIVTIDDDGRATGVKPGTTTIEARIEGKRATASVKVEQPPVDRVEISPKSVTLRVNERQQFTATARAADGSKLEDRSVSWSSSNPLVASVDRDTGRVRANLWGEARITATIEGKSASAEVRVRTRFGWNDDDDDDDDDDD